MGASTPNTRNCVSCGRAIPFDANVCQYCGHDFRAPAAAAPKEKSILSLVGGILILIAGIMGLVLGGIFIVAADAVSEGSDELGDWGIDIAGAGDLLSDILLVCGAMCLIFGIIAAVGGFFAIKRDHFALAVIGGIFGLLGLGFLIGSLLALIGLILVVIARKEFD